MSSCLSVATETQFQLLTSTSQALSTSFSNSVTTLPPTTSTSFSTICLSSGTASSAPACLASTVSPILVTNPGQTSTVSVPVVVSSPVVFTTSVPTQTLFSTSCGTSVLPTSLTSSTPTTTPSSTPSSSPSPSPSDSTTFTTSSSTTLPNGAVIVTSVVVTSVLPQSSVVASASPSPTLNESSGGGKTSSKTAPIVGGVVGGVIALLAVIGAIWFIWRRSKRWNDLFEEEMDEKQARLPRMPLDGEDLNPRPYRYGLVGHSDTPSPPRSPLGSVDLGNSFSNSIAALNIPLSHSRSSSGGALSTGESAGRHSPAPTDFIPRPFHLSSASSGAASTRPLLERPVNRPPSSWSVGNQNTRSDGTSHSRNPTLVRPNSAGGALQSPTASSATADLVPLTLPATEKRRLLAALPPGAAAPAPPTTSIAATGIASPPPIQPRSSKRPSTAPNNNTVVVHSDAGPASATPQRSGSNEPPAYSPT